MGVNITHSCATRPPPIQTGASQWRKLVQTYAVEAKGYLNRVEAARMLLSF